MGERWWSDSLVCYHERHAVTLPRIIRNRENASSDTHSFTMSIDPNSAVYTTDEVRYFPFVHVFRSSSFSTEGHLLSFANKQGKREHMV